MAEDHLRCQSLKDFAAFLVSLENSPLEFDSEAGEFSARIKSTQVSPVKGSSSLTVVQLDTSTQEEHEVHLHQDLLGTAKILQEGLEA